MAKIYQKNVSDKTLILGPRESFNRQIITGSAWSEVRIGIFASLVSDSNDNGKAGGQSVSSQNVLSNRIFIGLKDSSSLFPGSADTLFLGAMSSGSTTTDLHGTYNYPPYPIGFSSNERKFYAHGYYGSTPKIGANTTFNFDFPGDGQISGDSQYQGIMIVSLAVHNIGAANQQVVISAGHSGVAETPYDASNMFLYLSKNKGPTWTTLGTVNWNDGATAYPLPDSLFIYSPFVNARLRMSCIQAHVSSF
jgi:hypothetical protein